MQLTSTMDYAIRIVCYLAAQRQMISTSELSQELSVPSSYIPKITKKLKQAGIIKACEGTNGGYMLAKQPENISLMEIISCVEETMAINRCLEEDRFCSRNLKDTCKIHKILLSLQNTYNNKLESVKVSDVIRPGEDEYFGRFYVVLKLNLKEKSYECVYSHIREVYEKVRKTESYGTVEIDKIIDIANSTGFLLPSTGGRGAIVFAVIAALLVFGVAVSFIRDKRKEA